MAETLAQTKPKAAPAKAAPKAGKRAVILTGGHQYLVAEGDEIEIELLDPNLTQKNTEFEVLLVIEGDKVSVGTPRVVGAKVAAEILEQSVKADKVVAIRYKAKKRVRKVRGHRQKLTRIKIKTIGVRG